MCACVYTCVCVYVCMCIYICTLIYIHTYICGLEIQSRRLVEKFVLILLIQNATNYKMPRHGAAIYLFRMGLCVCVSLCVCMWSSAGRSCDVCAGKNVTVGVNIPTLPHVSVHIFTYACQCIQINVYIQTYKHAQMYTRTHTNTHTHATHTHTHTQTHTHTHTHTNTHRHAQHAHTHTHVCVYIYTCILCVHCIYWTLQTYLAMRVFV